MPYLDAAPADIARSFRIADTDLPDAAILVGQSHEAAYFDRVREGKEAILPGAVAAAVRFLRSGS